MMHLKSKAQNVIEFSFVFLVIMSIFLSIIELALFWRARFSIANIANEIVANTQIAAQNANSESDVVLCALNSLKKSAGLVNLSDSAFSSSGSNGSYRISSNFTKAGSPALVALLNINNLERGDISAGVVYMYTGIFLFREGRAVSSGAVQSVQKY